MLFVVQPIHGLIAFRHFIARIESGMPADRVRLYQQTIILEWVALAVLLGAWLLQSRPVADLGFVMPGGRPFWLGVGLFVILVAYLVYAWRSAVRMDADEKARHRKSLGSLAHFLPQSEGDLRAFVAASITAGIVEEILYRGFVLWYLLQLLPTWAAILASGVAFGLGHSYQGLSGIARVTLVGLAMGVFYLYTGSIWLPIVAHIAVDILQGAMLVEILRRDERDAPDGD